MLFLLLPRLSSISLPSRRSMYWTILVYSIHGKVLVDVCALALGFLVSVGAVSDVLYHLVISVVAVRFPGSDLVIVEELFVHLVVDDTHIDKLSELLDG